MHLDVRVAGEAAARTGMAGAADPDLLAVVDPGRDLDLELYLLERAAGTLAADARRLDDAPGAAAGRARLRAHELAEDAARDLLQLPLPPHVVQVTRSRPRLGALAVAALAGRRDLHLDGRASRRVNASASSISTATPTSPPRARPPRLRAEQVVAEEGREDVGQVREVEVAPACSRRA